MRLRVFIAAWGLAALFAVLVAVPAFAVHGGDTRVSVGSPPAPFAQNKQNEPAVAVDPTDPTVLAAGANDEIDLEACNAGDDTTCPFTEGVGVSGVYFSLDSGDSWAQPTYTGFTARDCLGAPGNDDPACDPHVGPIGTLPNYYENGLVSDGDPSVAFGPKPDGQGGFTYDRGARLYYANLTANFPESRTFKGFEAIAVSRTDNVQAAAAGNKSAWTKPVIVSKQNAALFSDKEQVWADNAASSKYFGNVYICNAAFRSQELSPNAVPEPIIFSRSTDGGSTWTNKQITNAADTGSGQGRSGGRQGCTVRTDSKGTVYVFYEGALKGTSVQYEVRSFDGGKTFTRPKAVARVTDVGIFDPNNGDYTFDGIGGARTNSYPSVDIANGAPTGADATDEIVMTWSDGPTPSDRNPGPNEQALVTYSTDGGNSFSTPVNAAPSSDRPDFPAIAISPDGTDAYLTYETFLRPWQSSTLSPPRLQQGVVLHADVNPGTGTIGAWRVMHRAPTGDARGSSANDLTSEFLGDYNYAAASRSFGVAVWNDVRNASNCPAIDRYRQEYANAVISGAAKPQGEDIREATRDQTSVPTPPAVKEQCPANFGNSDIYGGSYADPTTP